MTGPRIPREEFAQRRRRLSEALAAQGIEAWIAFGDHGEVMGPNHVRWLADVYPLFEPVLVVGGQGRPSLALTGAETVGYLETTAVVERTVGMTELLHPDEEYPTSTTIEGREALGELVSNGATVGLLGAERVPHDLQCSLIAPWVEAQRVRLVPVDATAYALRAVKSASEQAVIDFAYRLAKRGMHPLVEALRPGVTERELAARAEAVMREGGAEGSASPPPWLPASRAAGRSSAARPSGGWSGRTWSRCCSDRDTRATTARGLPRPGRTPVPAPRRRTRRRRRRRGAPRPDRR